MLKTATGCRPSPTDGCCLILRCPVSFTRASNRCSASRRLERANLLVALDHPEEPVRLNAAICLARWGDGPARSRPCVVIVENVAAQDSRSASRCRIARLSDEALPRPALGKLLDKFAATNRRASWTTRPNYMPTCSAHSRGMSMPRTTRASRKRCGLPGVAARQEALAAWGRRLRAGITAGRR